jgi:hypothetical protein
MPSTELVYAGISTDLAVTGGLVLMAGAVLLVASRLVTRRNYNENEVRI